MIKVYTKEELKSRCPAAFNMIPHERVSDKYALINTESVVDELLSHDMSIVGVNAHRDEKGAHLIEFQSNQTLDKPEVGGIVYRIGLWNSHNGLKPFKLLAQIYRYVCANGAKVGLDTFSDLRIIHRGSTERITKVIECAVKTAIERGPRTLDLVQQLQAKQLSVESQRMLAVNAILLRWPNSTPELIASKVDDTLYTRRPEDAKNDAWTVFNRIQENILRGHSMRSFQAVRSVNTDVNINRSLWDATLRIAA